ncbi:TetR family transcriptional regulator [Nocardia sp. NEAU-G5]|uniref:TetR family transcriptional regulator n=1 Tax=Nocardia albiluteola TaxID=2842303 RepID=A0ABS6B5H6_9NOCA|nr:TetR family transcriptional regulator [Nocardia albiluteola]MBU3062596.1 TetR family transcriptional regulator [Nocardia albiluteola]MBU3065570.1 TetR family transcriptional regulator [Nocardia albiluteola]
MPRWELGSEDRLKRAALELFDEKGFEDTSVVQIAKRAGVTTRTFFRYFSDKRDVLFAESDQLRAALVEVIRQAPDVGNPLHVVIGTLVEFDWESLGRDVQRRRQAVISANPELLERDLIKHDDIARAFTDALRQRGIETDIARLAARVGIPVFFAAYEQWLEAGNDVELGSITEKLMSDLESLVPNHGRPIR